ncbi:MAG: hypothetical protein FK731_03300 [Asgard group archaeon]|nr:hypothetical protein [Asgard group archaeon]
MKKKLKLIVISLLIFLQSTNLISIYMLFSAYSVPTDNSVILSAYEYHIVSVNATKGQVISGDWRATPADIISPPFLVFIIDTKNLEDWLASDNLTQAVGRIPSSELLYLYDPFFRLDDIPGDNYRSHVFQVKAPSSGEWHLVLYAGFTFFPLTFNWHIDVFESYFLDIVMYSLLGVFFISLVTIFTIKTVKDKKLSYEEEFEKIVQEQSSLENGEQRKSSLDEIDLEINDSEINIK